ncbi:unnamed protein product [Dibothriocephalus latus]|uniref:Reverse transcriptase domain-containing protein n=1 Tax=Dibothriocephalus latus TaxID=60516 RepID=A0A3P6QLS9_DIBLA|nr:unnamed protein product [Dibothriocephalus latus]
MILTNIELSVKHVVRVLAALKSSTSPGPDNLHPLIASREFQASDSHLGFSIGSRSLHESSDRRFPGFTRGKPCATNLLLARESCADSKDRDCPTHVVFIDVSKAFDQISH